MPGGVRGWPLINADNADQDKIFDFSGLSALICG